VKSVAWESDMPAVSEPGCGLSRSFLFLFLTVVSHTNAGDSRPCADCSRCSDLTSTPQPTQAVTCLLTCGFAFIHDAYDPERLDTLRSTYDDWVSRGDAALYKVDGHRGKGRVEHVLPWEMFSEDWLHFNELTSPVVNQFIALVTDKTEKEAIAMISVMDNKPGSTGQATHRDSHLVTQIKVHVPLVDIDDIMGPIHMFPASMTDKAARNSCEYSVVKGIARKGDVIMYQARLRHHGTGNNSSRTRPSLDFEYGSSADVSGAKVVDAYMEQLEESGDILTRVPSVVRGAHKRQEAYVHLQYEAGYRTAQEQALEDPTETLEQALDEL